MQLAVHCLTVELFSGGRQIGAAFVCAKLCESCGGAARATVLAGAWRAMARDAHVCGGGAVVSGCLVRRAAKSNESYEIRTHASEDTRT